jgi:enoyl-CoA hydratase/3-hydroxyacyl-CoA dehydrogenase
MSGTIRKVGVVGAGTMGAGIAQKLAQEGADVVLLDTDDARVAAGLARVRRSLEEAVARRIFDEKRAAAALARIRGAVDFAALAEADLVIEAVFEDLAVKRDVFTRLGAACRPDAVLATNTSSFPVAAVASAAARPERVLGLHFFYHPAKNRLVEVVPHERTDPGALARAWAFQERTGKTPIASGDAPGFIVNRFFVPWLNEATRILEEGVASVATVEAAAKAAFGIGMGPFELMNATGIPIALHSAASLGERLGPFYAHSRTLAEKVAQGGLWDLAGEVDAGAAEAVKARLKATVFLVAGEILDAGIGTAEDIDMGARVGLRWRAGPLELWNEEDPGKALETTGALAALHGRPLPAPVAARRDGSPFTLERVRLAIEGDIATITLARPDALNALDEAVVDEMLERFLAAEARPEVRGIVIRGMGKAFVAGADVRWFVRRLDAKEVDRIVAFTRRGQELFARFARSSKVVVAALEGLSLGGGSELALACDWIVSTPRGSLGFPETGIGIYPGLGGTQRLPRRVGRGLARCLVATGKVLSAKDAVLVGAFDALCEPEGLAAAVRERVAAGKPGPRAPRDPTSLPEPWAAAARAFDVPVADILDGKVASGDPSVAKDLERVRTQKAPVALRIADELVVRALEWSLEEGIAAELARLPEVFATRDAYEGLSTLGKSRPRFTGA